MGWGSHCKVHIKMEQLTRIGTGFKLNPGSIDRIQLSEMSSVWIHSMMQSLPVCCSQLPVVGDITYLERLLNV